MSCEFPSRLWEFHMEFKPSSTQYQTEKGTYCKLFLRQPALQCVILERRNTVGSSNKCAKIRKSFLEHTFCTYYNIPRPCFLSCLSLLYSLLSLLMAQTTRNDRFSGGISSMFYYYFNWIQNLFYFVNFVMITGQTDYN
jgi:hypothetical protein